MSLKIVAFVAFSMLASAAHADRLSEIKARGTLICGTVPNYEPFSFPDPQTRKLIGYDVDFCEAIAKKIGVSFEFKTMSTEARIAELSEGRVDILTANLGYTPLRAEQVDFTYSYFRSPQRVAVRDGKGYESLKDLAGKRISFQKGSTSEGYVKRTIEQPALVSYDDAPTAFLALVQGKVDAFASSGLAVARLIAKSAEVAPLKMLDEPLGQEAWGIGVQKGEETLLAAVNAALSDMEASGEAERIFDKWVGMETLYKQRKAFKIEQISQ